MRQRGSRRGAAEDHATHVTVDEVTGRCFECIGAQLRARATTPTARCAQLHDLYNVLQHAELGSDEFAELVQEALLSPLAEALFDPSNDVPSACACVLALPPLNEVDVMPELLLSLRVRAISNAVSDSSLVAIEHMLTQQRRRQAYAAPLHLGDSRALLSVLWSRVVLGSASAAGAALLNTLVELGDDSEHLLELVEICGSDERSCSRLLGHLARAAPLRARLVRTLLLAASCANARLASVFGSFFEDSSSHMSAAGAEHAVLLPSVLQKCLLGGAGVETATSTLRQRATVERERLDVTALILALATVPAFAQAFVANDVVEFIVEGLREENGSHSLQRALVHALSVIIDASGARVDRALAAAALRVLALHIIAPSLAHQLIELVDEALNVCGCLLEQHVGAAAPLSAAAHELPLMSPGGADALAASIGERSLSRATVHAGGTDVATVGAHISLLGMIVPLASPDGMLGIASLLDVTAATWSVELLEELSSLALALTDAAGEEYADIIDDVVDTIDAHIAPAFIGAAFRVPDGAVPRFAACIIALVALSSDAVLALVTKLLECDFHCIVLQLVERAAHAPSRQLLLSELFVCLFEVAHLVDCDDASTRKRWLDCVCRVPSSSAERALLLAGGPRRGGPSREEWRTLAEISFACWMCEPSIDDRDEARRVIDRYLSHTSHHALSRTALSHVVDVAAEVLVDLKDVGFSHEAEASLCKHLVEHVSFHRLAFVLAQRSNELYGALAHELSRWASQLALEDDSRAQDDAVASLLAEVCGVEHLLCEHVLSLAEVEVNRRNVPVLHAVRHLAEHSDTCAFEFDTARADRFLHAQLLQSRSVDRGARRCIDEIAGVAAALLGAPRSSDQRARCIGGADSLLSVERLCGYCAQRITAFAECEQTKHSGSAPISALNLLNALLDSPAHARRCMPNGTVVLSVQVIALSPSLKSESERRECARLAAMETLRLLCVVHSHAHSAGGLVFMEQLPLPLIVAAATTSRPEHRALALALGAARCSLSLLQQRRPLEPAVWCGVRRMHFELLQASVVGEEMSERRPAVRVLERFLRAAAATRDAAALCRSPWQGMVVTTLLARGCDAFALSDIALLGAIEAISATKLKAQHVEQLVARFTVELTRWCDGGAESELEVACYAALFTQPHLLGAVRELREPLARALGETARDSPIERASVGALLERVDAKECSRRCIDALRRLHFELRSVK